MTQGSIAVIFRQLVGCVYQIFHTLLLIFNYIIGSFATAFQCSQMLLKLLQLFFYINTEFSAFEKILPGVALHNSRQSVRILFSKIVKSFSFY